MLAIANDWLISRWPPTYANYFMLHKVFYCAKLSNKKSAKVICRLDKPRTTNSKSKKAIWVMEYLSAAYAFDYIVLRINPGLTTCKDLALMVDNSLHSNYSL